MAISDLFRFGNRRGISEEVVEEVKREEFVTEETVVRDVMIDEAGNKGNLIEGSVVSITEAVSTRSPESISKMIDSNDIKAEQLLSELRADYSDAETYKENEEMARDSIVGSAMENMADDVCQVDERNRVIVKVRSTDEDLAKFLQDFLEYNVNVEDRIWEWTLELIKHGDFKLRRREFQPTGSKVKDVYYENVLESYKVSRIEYMGKVIGYYDSEDPSKSVFEKPDSFVHFMNTKLPKRKRVTLQVESEKDKSKKEDVICTKVQGVSIMDNARYIFRIVNLLDNMLIMSRVARSTQYNLVKVEVGNASPAKTQEILSDVKRRLEGNTKIRKGGGLKTDPSPIPVNSNVYIPTREGKGEVTVESVNESVDVSSIVDIDYFRNKEFATIKTPKSYLGFEEELPGSMGNSSLVKLDIRYARPVQKVQNVIRYGIEDLCNNYLKFRGRVDDVGKFDIEMRDITTAENGARIEEFISNFTAFDAVSNMMETFSDFVDKARLLKTVVEVVGMSPEDIGNTEFIKLCEEIDSGKYVSPEVSEEEEEEEY